MTIYTRTGDQGQTGLLAGGRRWKDDVRVEAYGAVDELNSLLGWVRAERPPAAVDELVEQLQRALFAAGAMLAAAGGESPSEGGLTPADVAQLERHIDRLDASLPPLRQFVLPGGERAAAALHCARAVCRRAERRVVAAARRSPQNASLWLLVQYLNRLSDLLFVLARTVNAAAGRPETTWTGQRRPSG